jgi:hypothetical protein
MRGRQSAMITKVDSSVSVSLIFDSKTKRVTPKALVWNGRTYPIVRIGLHHTYRQGRTLYHVFSVAGKTLFFRLVLNSESLHWKLEEISDGLPS